MIKFSPFTWFFNFLFPSHCLSCHQADTWFCPDCLSKIPRSRESNLPHISACFPYDEPCIKKAVWFLKYRRIRELSQTFAEPMYEAIIEEIAEAKVFSPNKKKILLLPVPLTKKKLRKRGFNQAEELALALYHLNPNLFQLEKGLVVKIKETPTQVSLKDKKERIANLKGAFSLREKSKVKNKDIIIVDDVATTGSTIEEIRNLLLKRGAKSVRGLVIAHGR